MKTKNLVINIFKEEVSFIVIPHIVSGERNKSQFNFNLTNNTEYTVYLDTEADAKCFGDEVIKQIDEFYKTKKK